LFDLDQPRKMAGLRIAEEFRACVNDLNICMNRKRNLLQLLE
jgi:hypothetical protein